jgi:hypothetical protein
MIDDSSGLKLKLKIVARAIASLFSRYVVA